VGVGDYVQLARRIPRWPRQTRGTISAVLPDGWFKVKTSKGKFLEAREDDLIRLLRRSELSGR
jgi:hypothetical protein